MRRIMVRAVLVAAVIGLGMQAFVADAGFRRFFRAGCGAPSCSAPIYMAAPPSVCACCAPRWGCSAPMCGAPMCGAPGCFQPAYGYGYGYGMPMTAFSPAYGGAYGGGYGPAAGIGFGGTGYNPGYGGAGYGIGYGGFTVGYNGFANGYAGSNLYGGMYDYDFQPGYGAGYGGMGAMPVAPQLTSFGGVGNYGYGYGQGYGAMMPSYYAPVPSQYTPVPPAPASDLVW